MERGMLLLSQEEVAHAPAFAYSWNLHFPADGRYPGECGELSLLRGSESTISRGVKES